MSKSQNSSTIYPEDQLSLQNSEQTVEIEGDVEETVSLSSYSITSYNADYPVDGLVKRIQRNDIQIPAFQRSYVWKKEQASRFIESLLLGLPVPGIFLAKEPETNKLIVIDGQQRLKTLQYFYENRFPVANQEDKYQEFNLLGVAKQFNGKTYNSLSANDQRQLDDSILPATIVRQEEPQEEASTSMYYIFERLNTGGTPLSPQEIRASIYYGKFNQLLSELNQYETWQKIFQGKVNATKPNPGKRMKDHELILRFLALFFEIESYKESMKQFLNDFMEHNRNLQRYSTSQVTQIFQKTIDTVYSIAKEKAFRPRRGIHAAVFDAVMVGIARRLEHGEIQQIDCLKQAYRDLLESDDFKNSSINSQQMTNVKTVQKRIELATKKFQPIP